MLDYLVGRFSEMWFIVEEWECKLRACWHLEIRIPNYLSENWLVSMMNTKIRLYIDVWFPLVDYTPIEQEWSNPFLEHPVRTCPVDMLLSKKIKACFERQKWQWKDLFDIIFLLKSTQPDYNYLSKTSGINNSTELKQAFINFFNRPEIDLMAIAERMGRSYIDINDKAIVENWYNIIDMIQ